MAFLKSYSCVKCGGVLSFDEDQEFFDCPFCGTRFQSATFHRDELFSQANASLEQKAFELAREKYELVLADAPHDLDALLGIVLCEAGVSSFDELEDPAVFRDKDIEKIREAVNMAKDNSASGEKTFFEGLLELAELGAEIKKSGDVKKEVSSGATRKSFDEASEVVSGYDSLKALGFTIGAILLGGGVILWILGRLTDFALLNFIAGYMIAGFIFVALMLMGLKRKGDPAIDKYRHVANVGMSAKTVASRKEETGIEEYKKKFLLLKNSLPELKNSSKSARESVVSGDVNTDTSAVPEKDVACDKCGAKLSLDDSGRVYRCEHCGVAYGVSLFFGLPLEKALNALNAGYFAEADKRLSHVLMQEPSDFDACLGRILCCGRWTKISDVDYSKDLSIELIRKLEGLTKDAEERVSAQDKDFFVKVRDLTNALTKLMLNKKKQSGLGVRLDKLDAAKTAYSYSYEYVNSVPEKERREADYDLRTLQIEEEKIRSRIGALKDELIGMRSDSVFAK